MVIAALQLLDFGYRFGVFRIANNSGATLIQLESITKQFSGVTALDQVSLSIFPGEVHALCGENGAGKSTLMKVLAGIYPHSEYRGRIVRHRSASNAPAGGVGEELRFRSVSDAAAAGIAIVHQELALVPELTVLDNLFLGRDIGGRMGIDRRAETAVATAHFERLGFQVDLDAPVGMLGIGQQQRLEIARALLQKPTVLVLDEPTSALAPDDADSLLAWIRTMARSGTSCMYISHRMDEVFRVADRVTVLRDGRTIWTKPVSETGHDDVIAAMVDRPPSRMYARTPVATGKTLLHLRNVRVHRRRHTLLDVDDLLVRSGEIVGLAGMLGAGRTCLLRAVVGALSDVTVTGACRLPDSDDFRPLPDHPSAAIRHGGFLIPEDRKQQALFLDHDVATNICSASLHRFYRFGRIDEKRVQGVARQRTEQFAVKTPTIHHSVRHLSGGNQQKVLLCRAAEVAPQLLLLDEPTRGIDVGNKANIYRQMEAWTRAGWGILWCSSELQELLGISDRIYVLAGGRLRGEFDRRPFSETDVMAMAAQS